MESRFKCSTCLFQFTTSSNLIRHMKLKHADKEKIEPDENECHICFRVLGNKTNLKRHMNSMHNSIDTLPKIFKFQGNEAFYEWKCQHEKETKAEFVKRFHVRDNKNGTRTQIFYCHRSGFYKKQGNNLRHMKVGGSNKINGVCPARIKYCQKPNGTIVISLWDKHEGHQMEIGRTRLTKHERSIIAKKIAAQIPFSEILNDLKHEISDTGLSKIHLLTKKDLYNIERDLLPKSVAGSRKNELENIDSWVLNEEANIVRFYKTKSTVEDELNQLKPEDFVLIIMSASQGEVLKEQGDTCICLDSVKGINAYDCHMHILFVLSKKKEGFPCALMFSNRNDSVTSELFFNVIKCCLDCSLKPKIFMSDVNDTFYNAWCAVMQPPPLRLYNSWNVDKAWRSNLNKIKSKINRVSVYKQIRTLMEENSISSFETMYTEFMNEIKFNEDTQCFAEYFDRFKNKSAWAYCYRIYFGLNTDMYLSKIHRIVNQLYLNGNTHRRLDNAIFSVIKFVENKLFDEFHKIKLSTKMKQNKFRHKAALKMKSANIVHLNEKEWDIKSESESVCYRVTKLEQEECSTCSLPCGECCTCPHVYSCTCDDNNVKQNMCKHIHLVCIRVKNVTDITYDYVSESNLEQTIVSDHDYNPMIPDHDYNPIEISELNNEVVIIDQEMIDESTSCCVVLEEVNELYVKERNLEEEKTQTITLLEQISQAVKSSQDVQEVLSIKNALDALIQKLSETTENLPTASTEL